MSNTTTQSTASAASTKSAGSFVKITGIVIAVIGAIMFIGGASTWILVQTSLADERITVAEDADWFAGQEVNGPFTAYSEAMIIEKHALEGSGGKTYAELDREDPARASVMNGSFLRASLFTSVLAFGVSAMAMGLGIVQVLGGLALTKVGKTIDA
ncbi:MAG TPA: aromatic ring-opening dioxygenase LigA [Ornithinibacter sp.]|nr:aromatic ring-opening dioxygenase LigA [Ornithinibacter sp.]